MSNIILVLLVVIVLSVGPAYAQELITKASGSVAPTPLFKEPDTGMEFVFVKGGCYQMGDLYGDGTDWHGAGESNEKPVHEVCVDDYYIGKYEVTRGQWRTIMGSNAEATTCDRDSCPVDYTSWDTVQDFISRLNKKSGGSKFRLPTEAEWEYAARSGGKSERYSGGNDVDSVAWYNINSGEDVHAVGTKAPNGLGLYDMSGNVWETTNDWYRENYSANSPPNNPIDPTSSAFRVQRGGNVTGGSGDQRVSRRGAINPNVVNGFRLMRTP